jgi:small subunit ribosomal protein S20
MANTRSAAKRARETVNRTLSNKAVLTGIKSQEKKLNAAIAAGEKTKAEAELVVFASHLDKAAKRGIIHQNLADRRKSRAAHAIGVKFKA